MIGGAIPNYPNPLPSQSDREILAVDFRPRTASHERFMSLQRYLKILGSSGFTDVTLELSLINQALAFKPRLKSSCPCGTVRDTIRLNPCTIQNP